MDNQNAPASASRHSPSQPRPYTPAYPPADSHARHRSTSYNNNPVPPSPRQLYQHPSVPASPTIPRQPPPLSPATARERPSSGYYDPTSDARSGMNLASYQSSPPMQNRPVYDQVQPAPPYANGHNPDARPDYRRHSSQASPPLPYVSTHAHPMPPAAADQRSPTSYREPPRSNGTHSHTASIDSIAPLPPPPPPRSTNPMSMMNLLSDTADPAPPPAPPAAVKSSLPETAPVSAPAPVPVAATPATPIKASTRKTNRASTAQHPVVPKQEPEEQPRLAAAPRPSDDRNGVAGGPFGGPAPPPIYNPPQPLGGLSERDGPPGLTDEGVEAAYQEIENADLSDVEDPAPLFAVYKREWEDERKKRSLEDEVREDQMRKRRRVVFMLDKHEHFMAAAESEKTIYVDKHEQEVAEEVRLKEIEEDKERKKDQQRKRRREKAIADEQIKREEAIQTLAAVDNEEDRLRLEKEIQRADKKIRDTRNRLEGITPVKEPRHESPHNTAALGRKECEVPLEGGHMTSFYSNNTAQPNDEAGTPEFTASGRGRGRGGRGGGAGAGRARKSKEQKQAEKDNARRGQEMIDSSQDLPTIAAKEEERLASYTERKAVREESDAEDDTTMLVEYNGQPTSGLTGMARFDSKGYNQIYEQITREIAKNCVPKITRIKNNSLDTKQSNARKTAQLASKEAKRWQQRTNKSTKDVAARAKRAMREMIGFWKRNERDEREGRKVAEKHELEKARRAEADREANRQKRKLNFLISQTELYSHFIGKKVKTDEIEKHGNDSAVASEQTTVEDPNAKHMIDLPDSVANLNKKVTNFEDLDFDAEDETALQEAAMANAQNAIQEAQDRARAFNKPEGELTDAQANFDEGEMNFQNPTSLQSMDVEQPKMLTCKLKEYQLKGLNWLVNLYEQGINGILADEMGLGKTVQSISVMAYLAEVHNIWGPFLVIAPASTLHNWQQEIAKFVPTLKVLPYWGSAKDRKVLRKFWDRKHITYARDSQFHVLVTSYQLVVADTNYFQKVKWQYMILDEAQAIKSSQSSRWKSLLGFHCRNRLLLTGTPIQNNMQELWALLHFIMPSLFDSHDEFSEWFSKDIENHAQSNSKLNEDQLRRLHMILKPFMLRRIKKHVQKELGDKIEEDVFCDLTYRQRAYYTNLRNKISFMDLIEKAAGGGDDQDTATLMNLVMQFRKVCNHPDLFERAEIWSPMSMSYYAETASFMREGTNVNVAYSVRNLIEFWLPKMLGEDPGRLNIAGPKNEKAGWRKRWLHNELSIWDGDNVYRSSRSNGAFSWLRFVDDQTANDVSRVARDSLVDRVVSLAKTEKRVGVLSAVYDNPNEKENFGFSPVGNMLNIVGRNNRRALSEITSDTNNVAKLLDISKHNMQAKGYEVIEACYLPPASAPPIELVCPSERASVEKETALFNIPLRRALYPVNRDTELALLQSKLPRHEYPITNLLPAPASSKQRYTQIQVPSMRRFVTDSGKLARLDRLLRRLKEGGHRVLLYFQMTRMIDLMEEYLTYRNYKYCRLDGSTKLEDRRDTVAAFQSSPEIFVFLLSTRAGGLGINLTSADTVIFYDSDWNPTIDSQAMDRAHRLGQTRQVTVYRLITRGTIEERIRKRALQKEEVQRVVISGQAGGGNVDFTNRGPIGREGNRTKEMAMWLADDDQAAMIERREAEVMKKEEEEAAAKVVAGGPIAGKKRKNAAAAGAKGSAGGGGGRKSGREFSMDDMYHEGEGKFEDGASHEPSGAATPVVGGDGGDAPLSGKKRKGVSKKAKTISQRLAVVDGEIG